MAGIHTYCHGLRLRTRYRVHKELDRYRTCHALGPPLLIHASYFAVLYELTLSLVQDLWKIAKQHKRPFAGSTSSLTGLLSHCYFLISGDKEVDTSSLSRAFLHQVSPANSRLYFVLRCLARSS